MARAEIYGVTGRPSTRATAAAAAKPDAPGAYYRPTGYTPSRDISISRGDAEKAVEKSRPELFWNDSQIRAKIIDDLAKTGRNEFGGVSRARYISKTMQETLERNRRERDEIIEKEYARMARQEEVNMTFREREAENVQRGVDRKARETAMTARDENATRATMTDKETERYLNYLETSSRIAIKSNPDLYEGFEDYKSYATQLAEMPMKDREEQLRLLREEANDIVDPYFDMEDQRVKEDLRNTIRQLDEQFGLFKEAEKYQLDQKINSLTRQAAEGLSDRFVDMKRRGVLDSGIARGIADKIIEGKTREEDFEKVISNFRMREETMKKQFATEKVSTAAERAGQDIARERETEQQRQFFGLLSEEEARTFLSQYPSASRLRTYGEAEDPSTATTQTTSQPGTRGLPPSSYSAPAGSSLDLARRAAAGTINIDEQRRMRDALLNPTSAPTRVTSSTPNTTATTPTQRATTTAGQRLLQNAAARRAERLSRAR